MSTIRVAGTVAEVNQGSRRRGRRRWRSMVAVAVVLVASAGWSGGVAVASVAGVANASAVNVDGMRPAAVSTTAPDLGPNVYIFSPSMPQSVIQETVDSIAAQQVSNQFGSQRYALLFQPGTYGSAADPLIFQVGYYTEVAGLGTSPAAVTINGSIDVYNQCLPTTDGSSNCIALDNFWRSLSNLTIDVAGGTGCQTATEFWAVSQAAPMRRVAVNGGVSLMDYCSPGPQYASGGFIADSAFTGGTVVNGSQQQFFVRNSSLDGWSNGVWNQVFAGDPGAPAQSFSATSGLAGGTAPYTTLATSPVTAEEPFLQTDTAGRYSVFAPAVRQNSTGPSWTSGSAAGASLPIGTFFVATPATPVLLIDAELALGRNLILTPGVYQLKAPIVISRRDTVVLGLGFPTLIPQHGLPAMVVANVPGAKMSGIIIDAGPVTSAVLLQVGVGPGGRRSSDPADPTLVQDVFFRIGGAEAGSATDSLVVDSSNVILDDIWAWRADHGTGVGWTTNTADTGLIVNGDNVTAYGLFVEHYQKTEVIWNGQHGTDIFFQNELPYDPPSQAAWMSGPTTQGYPAFAVSPDVTTFQGFGMGSYCFFNQGIPVEEARAFEVGDARGVQLHDIFTRFLGGSGSINSVVNGSGAAVTSDNPGPSDIVTYP